MQIIRSDHYISRLVAGLQKSGADNVGGCCITEAATDTLVARGIAEAISHPFGVGNSYYAYCLCSNEYGIINLNN